MSLYDRIHNPDRRQTEVTPLVERRTDERRATPRWMEWTREHEAAKALSGQVAA